jgi:hypothetical protein
MHRRDASRQNPALGAGPSALLAGFFLTNVGNGAYTLAVGQLIHAATGSILGYALVVFSEFGFKLLAQGVTGPDRLPAARLCAAFDTVRAVAMAVAAVLLLHGSWLPAVVVATLAINLVKPFYISATFRLVVDLVPERAYETYNAGFIAVRQGGFLLGVLLFGALAGRLEASTVVWFNAGSYVAMASVMAVLARRGSGANGDAKVSGGGWADTVRLCRDRPLLRQAVLASHDGVLIYLMSLYVLATSESTFAAEPRMLPVLQGALVAGSAAAVVVVRRVPASVLEPRRSLPVLVSVEVLALVVLALAGSVAAAAAVALAVLGAAAGTSASLTMSALMRLAKGRARGRVAGLQLLVTAVLMIAAGAVMTPVLDVRVGTALAVPLVLCGGFALLLRLAVRARQRDVDANEPAVSTLAP